MEQGARKVVPPDVRLAKHASVLLIENEQELVGEISSELNRVGYSVRNVDNIADGVCAARSSDDAIIIVEPLVHGRDVQRAIETLRGEGVTKAILVASALSSVDDRVRGLNSGADDYLAKPFAVAELAARVAALHRRMVHTSAAKVRAGSLELDLIERTVKCGGVVIDLSAQEFKLLRYFFDHPGAIVPRSTLRELVWRRRVGEETNTFDVFVGNLRRKTNTDSAKMVIRTVPGVGFVFDPDA